MVELSLRGALPCHAVGSVTHRDLLFESPVKLPFLNVDLPLVGFFVLGPSVRDVTRGTQVAICL